MEGDFGVSRGVGRCGSILGGPRWSFGGLSSNRTSKRRLQENLQEAAGDLQEVYMRMLRAVLEVLKVGKWVERVAEG